MHHQIMENGGVFTATTTANLVDRLQLGDFWTMSPAQRESILLQAIAETHARHYACNKAYRHTVAARGVGAAITRADLPRLLRPTAQTFKSYVDILGTPFPQTRPHAFLNWLADQLSVELPQERFSRFAEACGARGVTAIRTVGRGAFPQLAYSWDGLIPQDLVRRRSAGRFTTIEFDAPYKQMLQTYHLLLGRGVTLGLAGK